MKLENNWRQKSLENLERRNAGTPHADYSNLVNNVSRLRRLPLNDLSVENIRFMIGQNEGLMYLVPLAIDILKGDIFAQGDFYPGDLLQNVLKLPALFWKGNRELWKSVNALIKDRLKVIVEHNISVQEFYDIVI